nr:retrovirus-related Pol polyprotein from transposon TNT 1-94 [Tanacetum cinerariifolium]
MNKDCRSRKGNDGTGSNGSKDPKKQQESSSAPRRSERARKKKNLDLDFIDSQAIIFLVEGDNENNVVNKIPVLLNVEDAPKTYKEAITSNNSAFWKEAIDDEMDSLVSNNTWELSDLPPGSKAVGCRWVKWIENGAKTGIYGFIEIKSAYYSISRQSREKSPSMPWKRAQENESNVKKDTWELSTDWIMFIFLSIRYKEYLEKSPDAITTVLPIEEPEYSLSMGYEHLSTILKTEYDEVIESSAKNLLPIPSEYEVTSDDEKETRIREKNLNGASSSKVNYVDSGKNNKGNNKKRKGHIKRYCKNPKKKNQNSNKKDEYANAVEQVDTTEITTMWYDSGATTHVCNNKDLFKTYKETEDGHEVMIGDNHTSKGLILQRTAPYTPQQNGVAERKNRVLHDIINAMNMAESSSVPRRSEKARKERNLDLDFIDSQAIIFLVEGDNENNVVNKIPVLL